MSNPNKPSYTHGSTGTEPSSAIDYANGDDLDADNFDYFVNTPFEKIKEIIDRLVAIDSDGDGKVDEAEQADDATNVTSTYKGNDIDSDGDGKVNSADTADTVKSNDIDSDGDGVVDSADSLKTGGSTATVDDTTNNQPVAQFQEGGSVAVPNGPISTEGSTVSTQPFVQDFGGAIQTHSYLVEGGGFTPDYTTPSVDVSSGEAFIVDQSLNVGYKVTWSTTTVTLTDADVNHVYVDYDPSTDTTALTANTTGTAPNNTSLKIGEVDTSGDTYTDQWYLASDTGELTFPNEAAIDTADADGLREGTITIDRKDDRTYMIK